MQYKCSILYVRQISLCPAMHIYLDIKFALTLIFVFIFMFWAFVFVQWLECVLRNLFVAAMHIYPQLRKPRQ